MSAVRWTVLGAASFAVVATAVLVASHAAASTGQNRIPLATLVETWPSSYTVTGTKAEPLYTERIRLVRDGDIFAVQIEVLSQGTAALGSQTSVVGVTESGAIRWVSGCTKSAGECADDPALRGFLSTAVVVAALRMGALPEEGVLRDLHGRSVVCVDDAALHPYRPPTVALDPCLDLASGAVLGHWSPDSEAFVGATLADGFRITASPPAPTP